VKIIFSRKGFDSGYGGVPSPVFPNGQLMSLPIPGGQAPHRFDELTTPVGPMGPLVQQLTGRPAFPRAAVHLDPDLDAGSVARQPGWRGSLGQAGAAQSHLASQGVGPGDLFLFFGWFREVEQTNDAWNYRRGAPGQHVLFGYLQIGQVLTVGAQPDTAGILAERPWLHDHPHLDGERSVNNTIYLAADELILPSGPTGRPGAGAFDQLTADQVLTAPGQSKSRWRLPGWCGPVPGERSELTYHGDPARWAHQDDGSVWLTSVAKGQEFVMDLPPVAGAEAWLRTITHGALRGAVPAPAGLVEPKAAVAPRRRRLG